MQFLGKRHGERFDENPTTEDEQNAFRKANVEAGYRLRPESVTVRVDAADPNGLGVEMAWRNDNVAPTYLATSRSASTTCKRSPIR